jgi:amino acid permease
MHHFTPPKSITAAMQQETTYGAAEIELDEERNYGRANSKPFGRTALPHGVALIGGFGSYALVVNNISGPGMLDFPQAFQAAGWLPCVLCILGVAAVSAAVACALTDAHASLRKEKATHATNPTSRTRAGRWRARSWKEVQSDSVEFSEMFGAAYGGAIFRGTQLLYFLNLFSQNVAAIVTTAQATDSMIAALFGYSYALNVPHFTIETWEGCKREGCVPFRLAAPGLLLTAGYAFCFVTLGPLGFFTLQENMLAQKISFVLLVALTLQFLAYFVTSPDPHRVSVIGPRPWDVVGVVIFNFAFCVTVPAWLNEKVPQVNAKKTIWAACLSSAVAYCLVGWLGGVAIARASDNVLDELTSTLAPTSVRFGGGVFAFAIIGLGVPVYCVLMRYNLRAGGLSEFWSHILAGAGPWAVSWLVYRGHGILEVLSWSGLILNAAIDFIAPMVEDLCANQPVCRVL